MMKDETRNQLNEVVVMFDKAVAGAHRGRGEGEQVQQDFGALCRDVIRPSMEAFADVLRAHGHTVRVYGHDMAVDTGGHSRDAEVLMHVTTKNGTSSAEQSPGEFEISVSFDMASQKMLAQVRDAQGGVSSYARPYDLHPIEGVTAELVERELLEMVRHGFECVQRKAESTAHASAWT